MPKNSRPSPEPRTACTHPSPTRRPLRPPLLLSREELCYILDPKALWAKTTPAKAFGPKDKELKAFGEYRTMRLVLEAWDEEEIRRMKDLSLNKRYA